MYRIYHSPVTSSLKLSTSQPTAPPCVTATYFSALSMEASHFFEASAQIYRLHSHATDDSNRVTVAAPGGPRHSHSVSSLPVPATSRAFHHTTETTRVPGKTELPANSPYRIPYELLTMNGSSPQALATYSGPLLGHISSLCVLPTWTFKVNKIHFSISSRPDLGPTQPHIHWVPGGSFITDKAAVSPRSRLTILNVYLTSNYSEIYIVFNYLVILLQRTKTFTIIRIYQLLLLGEIMADFCIHTTAEFRVLQR